MSDRCKKCGACKECGATQQPQFIPYYPNPYTTPYRPYYSYWSVIPPNYSPNISVGQTFANGAAGSSASGITWQATNNSGNIQ